MSLRLAVLKNVFDAYSTRAYSLLFLFIVIIYFILKEKKEQRNLLIYEIFGILLLVTPFIGNKIVTLGAGNGSNWPVYGILCAIPVTAYAAVDILKDIDKKKERCKFLILFFVVLQLGLGISFTGAQFLLPQNMQKTSNLTLRIENELDDASEWKVMAPLQIAGELRECNEKIVVHYNEDYEELQKELLNVHKEAEKCNCNCVILEKQYDNEEFMLAGGFTRLADIDGYIIYIKNNS